MYRVELTREAEGELAKICSADPRLYGRFLECFEELRRDPGAGNPLRREVKSVRSYRVGSYRILYRVARDRLLVIVLDLSQRREI